MRSYLPAATILTKHTLAFGKFFRRLQQLSHQKFALLPLCSDLVSFYWSQVVEASNQPPQSISDEPTAVYPLRFLVQGMVLFKENLAQWTVVKKDGTINSNTPLNQSFVEDAVRLLVTRFMPLNSSDLERWTDDPEEWLNEEERESDHWEFEIRACSERVLVQLANQFPEWVTPLLINLYTSTSGTVALDLNTILQKEALYCAIGRCAIRLKDVLDFDQWLRSNLKNEAGSPNPEYAIIKRRIAWLIGKWISDQCSSPNNTLIWDILVHLLQDRSPGSQAVVRLTAANAIRECVDTLEFSSSVFAPYIGTTINELVRLIDEAETSESKRRVAGTLNALLEQTKGLVSPYIAVAVNIVPKLWTEAGDDWLLKGTLLTTVTKLVEAVKENSSQLNSITVPIIADSLSPGVMINLDEDGMILWLSALQNAPGLSPNQPSLLDLFPRALALLSTNLDLLGKVTGIIESYFLLDAPLLLQAFSKDIFAAFTEALKHAPVTINLKDMSITLQFLVQVAPSSLWGEPFHTSGLFSYLLDKVIDDETSPMFSIEIIFLFSRIVMGDPQMFLQLMAATPQVINRPEEKLWEGLLDAWWGKFDNMSEPRHRKLTAMGIATLVGTGRQEVLGRLSGEIFNLWLDVFGEIKETRLSHDEDPTSLDLVSPTNLRRHWELDEAPQAYYQDSEGTPEYDRRKALYDRDPIRVAQLNEYVGAQIRQAETLVGSERFQTYLRDADPTVLKQILNELS